MEFHSDSGCFFKDKTQCIDATNSKGFLGDVEKDHENEERISCLFA